MENYLDLINEYFRIKNNLIRFNSYSNDVRLFDNHIVKTLKTRERLENCVVGLQIMRNTSIKVPMIQFVCQERNTIVENYIYGITLNEYTTHLTTKMLYEIGRLLGKFHSINISSKNDEDECTIKVLADLMQIKQKLSPYENDFMDAINFVENESKQIFNGLHFTYVHGDFRPANIIFNQQKKHYYVIDFENFSVGDSMLDIYKMLSILETSKGYTFNDVKAFLDGYSSVKSIPKNLDEKWIFYDVYYSLRSVRRAINDNNFRNSNDAYIINADMSAQRKNPQTLVMMNWLNQYIKMH